MSRPASPGVDGALRAAAGEPPETTFDPQHYARFPTQGGRPAGEFARLEQAWASPPGWRRFS
ncbi:hypothetical protein LZB50_09500, partial [Campylobacter jejuni]|uniref:hypothetical protein n=1 Tax=Campylobacter jejuni TaxID=197 RepID=UPI001F098510